MQRRAFIMLLTGASGGWPLTITRAHFNVEIVRESTVVADFTLP
jgi:hypothetical protein